ncbi:putative quinone-oxidoreductase homolog, chloroplastic [Phalaenopsis equestris]|uniref:putative quinone-oxidoreductase homolog, chloroplastic n=1 Tax=Phalaenopsis equestris TaxID=78828 RepID=UPI0009E319F3|nr:putative quinone-oxidoreductase homolog, chloroplastic [Phalaenopsis equestris]
MAAEKTMHAVQYGGYGGGAEALKHVEVPIPLPKKNEVLLKIDAAAINPFDWKVQKGAMRPFLPPKFPFTPVEDVAGEVVDVGPEVKSLKQGDKVVSLLSTGGGLAEYAVASANLTTTIPPTIPPPEAAGLPAASLTALQALRSAGCFDLQRPPNQQPKNILITAASGGVGHFATQLAKLANLHVTATCGARNMELVRSLGADEVLDYKTPEGASLKSPSEKKYDAVIHCATGISWSEFKPNLAEGGKVIDITPTVKVMLTWVLHRLTFCKKQLVPLLLSPEGKDLEFIVGLVKEGKLRTVVDSRYPLEKAEEAWGKSMAGHATGKIIVEM